MFLNDLEEQNSGRYDIVSILNRQEGTKNALCVVVRLKIKEVDPVFDEAVIKQKLGF